MLARAFRKGWVVRIGIWLVNHNQFTNVGLDRGPASASASGGGYSSILCLRFRFTLRLVLLLLLPRFRGGVGEEEDFFLLAFAAMMIEHLQPTFMSDQSQKRYPSGPPPIK